MTPQAINEAIARELGWKRDKEDDYSFGDSSKRIQRDCWLMPNGIAKVRKVPNYYESLDACGEFEKTLIDNDELEESVTYLASLQEISGCEIASDDWLELKKIICATSQQRCEAFLRLKNLWKE